MVLRKFLAIKMIIFDLRKSDIEKSALETVIAPNSDLEELAALCKVLQVTHLAKRTGNTQAQP
jgi:hypothetical protein